MTKERRGFTAYHLVMFGVFLSIGALIVGFEYELSQTTAAFVDAFRSQNATALESGDVFTISSRLNDVTSSVNWTCLSATKDHRRFLDLKQGSCANGFFQRHLRLLSSENPGVVVDLTLRLPRPLEVAFLAIMCFQLLSLSLIFWGAKKVETERHLEEARRTEERRREQARRAEEAADLAHDIRSPLAALDSAMEDVGGIPERKRVMIRTSLNRIRDIANNLLDRHRAQRPTEARVTGAERGVFLLSDVIDSLVSEKREEFRSRQGIELYAKLDVDSYGLFAIIEPSAFKRTLSNLINNGVEALGRTGHVSVSLSSSVEGIAVRVQDNGKGIPRELIPRLGQIGETHDKAAGTGRGLHQARIAIESLDGRLAIDSEVGIGTTVTIRLPAAAPPAWFVPSLELRAGTTVVVLDDETSIHDLWQERFALLQATARSINIVCFFQADAVRTWVRENSEQSRGALFLADYELIGQDVNGLDLIEDLGLSDRAVLITSRFDEKGIRDRCAGMRMRMVPKTLAGFVPIIIRDSALPRGEAAAVDAVFIDDDDLTRSNWEDSAEKHGKVLRTFSSPEDFLVSAAALRNTTVIYLDSKLRDGRRGEVFAKELYSQGFRNLYLATGYVAEEFDAIPWIKAVVGKDPPWG
jgi:signal transduction histidine kinase